MNNEKQIMGLVEKAFFRVTDEDEFVVGSRIVALWLDSKPYYEKELQKVLKKETRIFATPMSAKELEERGIPLVLPYGRMDSTFSEETYVTDGHMAELAGTELEFVRDNGLQYWFYNKTNMSVRYCYRWNVSWLKNFREEIK